MAPTETNTDRLNWDVYVTPATPIAASVSLSSISKSK
jgi:hypothetical protein